MKSLKQYLSIGFIVVSQFTFAQAQNKDYFEAALDPHHPSMLETDHSAVSPSVANRFTLRDLPTYMTSNLKYPQLAQENTIEGTVKAKVIINKLGQVTAVKILEGLNRECDQAVVRMFLEMPRWIPFTQQGRPITKALIIQVRFRMV